MGIINVSGMEIITKYSIRTKKHGDMEIMRGFREKLIPGQEISIGYQAHEVVKAETEKKGDAVFQSVVVVRKEG